MVLLTSGRKVLAIKHNIRVPNFSRKKMLSDEEGRHLLKLNCELYKVSESQVAECLRSIYNIPTHTCSINYWALAKAELLHHQFITWVYEQLGLSDTLPARVAQIVTISV